MTFTTKFNKGDLVYIRHGEATEQVKITGIEILLDERHKNNIPSIYYVCNHGSYKCLEHHVFGTKEEANNDIK